ncbi:MAG: hypothetical protein QME58_14035 [Bacteroidota bacterium]|nr:hypothetical protein [Bacteroidota bacterium]
MPFTKVLVADSVVQRLIENQSIHSLMNRSFDGLVRPGATSVDVPAMPILVVKTAGTPPTHADRKKLKADTTMVNIPFTRAAIPIAGEIFAQLESNGMLLREFTESAAQHFSEKFDSDVIVAAQGTTDKTAFAGATMAWADIIDINAKMDNNKVPKSGRVIVVSATLAGEFFNIDVVKNAASYQRDILAGGQLISLMGMRFFISGLVPTVLIAKANMVGIHGPGLAFILNRMMDVEETYDVDNLQRNVDFLASYGVKLFDNKFAVVKHKP